jgi:hypothetical protein
VIELRGTIPFCADPTNDGSALIEHNHLMPRAKAHSVEKPTRVTNELDLVKELIRRAIA